MFCFARCQVVSFHATTKTRSMADTVIEYKHGELKAGGNEQWIRQSIPIPPLPPSNLIYCNIIDVRYYVIVSTQAV